MASPAPPISTLSPWLHLAARFGKFGAAFLIVSCFAAMFAPLVFLVDAQSLVDSNAPSSSMVALFSDPGRVLAISDFIALLGLLFLSAAIAFILLGLVRGDKPLSFLTFTTGAAAFLCLAAWVPVMLYAQGQARNVNTLDAAAMTGGWGVASGLLLGASLAYLFLTLRIEKGRARRITSLWWPVYGAVNVLGAVAIAGVFAGSPSGSGGADTLSLGLVLKVTLVPMLGVMAYGDLKDRFPRWEHVPLLEPPAVEQAPVPAADAAPPMGTLMGLPLPPPPSDVDPHGPLVTVSREEPELIPGNRLRPPPPPSE